MPKPAEAFWETTYRTDYHPMDRTEETWRATDQHRACYSRPFDLHPQTEKSLSTTTRDMLQDHMAAKDDHPMYWKDMKVRIPPGSASVGRVLGDKPPP
jgi:hypothetical protein